jgi:integrase/recombinase XerD
MKQARVLSSCELKRVLTAAAASKHEQRNRIALLLSHYAGLRVGEFASLCWTRLGHVSGSSI